MTKALFVTTTTTEPIENVDAWVNTMGPAEHFRFDINNHPRDAEILATAENFRPEVIFYTGGESGAGIPSINAFQMLRQIAPTILFQGDMADPPWWPAMERYRDAECFDLMLAM